MRFPLRGTITSTGFASGDRFVVGRWNASPIGPFSDVMWAKPSGERFLLASSDVASEFISAVYGFDAISVVNVTAHREGHSSLIEAGPVALEIETGGGWRIPGGTLRPAWWHRLVEGPIARATMGVRVYGASPTGVFEWYRADVYRKVTAATCRVDGESLGPMGPLQPPCRFGFSEPPRRPSLVEVRPLLWDPSGRLDGLITQAVGDPATSATPSAHR